MEKKLFNLIYYGLLVVIMSSIIIYNRQFFLGLTAGGVLQLKHQILFYLSRTILIIVGLFMIFFREYIYKKRKEFLLLLLTILIMFFILEISVRLIGTGTLGTEGMLIYSPHHYLNYYGTPNYISEYELNIHNSLGFRGPEIKLKKDYRIVIIGGSVVYGTGVKSWEDDFARQLQKRLDSVEVINAGLGSWNSWESLINFEFKVLDLEPDMIIIHMGANDVTSRVVNQEVYKSDNSGLRKQWEIPKTPLIFNSAVMRYLTRYNIGLLDVVDASTGNEGMEYLGYTEKLDNTASGILDINKPIYYERNIKSIIAIAKENNIKILLSTLSFSNEIGRIKSLPYVQKGINQNNEVIRNISLEKNITIFDFIQVMPKDKKYWTDGMHFTKEGEVKRAELFVEYIKENKLLEVENVKIN